MQNIWRKSSYWVKEQEMFAQDTFTFDPIDAFNALLPKLFQEVMLINTSQLEIVNLSACNLVLTYQTKPTELFNNKTFMKACKTMCTKVISTYTIYSAFNKLTHNFNKSSLLF